MPNKYENLSNNIIDISEAVYPGADTLFFGDYSNRLRTQEGLCFGLVFMWGRSVLVKEEFLYFQRLDILTRDFENNPYVFFGKQWNNLGDLLVQCHLVFSKNPGLLDNPSMNLLISIRAFLDGLTAYQNPEETTMHTNRIFHGLAFQNQNITSDLLSHNLHLLLCMPFIGPKSLLIMFIRTIILNTSSVQNPFFVSIVNTDHCVGMTISQNECKLFDPNNLHRNDYIWSVKNLINQEYMLDDLANEIGMLFGIKHNRHFNIVLKIWTLNEYQESFCFDRVIDWLINFYTPQMCLKSKNFIKNFVLQYILECDDCGNLLGLFLNRLSVENFSTLDPNIFVIACENGNSPILNILLKNQRKFSFNVRDFINQNYILHLIIKFGYAHLLNTLFDQVDDINIENIRCGYTPLAFACAEKQDDAILILLRHGAIISKNMYSLYIKNNKQPKTEIIKMLFV